MSARPSEREHAGCEGCGLGRRDFLLGAAALALSACAGDGGATGPTSVAGTIDVTSYPALAAANGVALVTVGGAPLAIVRTGESSFVALSRVCPHQGATVNRSTGGFTCPRHGARFGPTGAWVAGERTSSLRSYPTRYDAVGQKLTIG